MSFDDLELRTKTLVPQVGTAAILACVTAGATSKLNGLVHRRARANGAVDPDDQRSRGPHDAGRKTRLINA